MVTNRASEDFIKGFITLKRILISDELADKYILELLCVSNIACDMGISTSVVSPDKWKAGEFTIENDDEECDVFSPHTLMISSDAFMLAKAAEKGLATVGIYEPGTEPDMALKCDILVEGMEDVDIYFLDRISKRKEKLPWITAVTERTYLREMTLSDLDRLYEIYAEDGMTDYMEDLYEKDEETEYIKHYVENIYYFYGYGMWLVCLRDSGKVIGRAGIEQRNADGDTLLELGYLISNEYQHQGYASEVVDELIKFASDNLYDFDTLNVFIRPGNEASINLVKHKGFTENGHGTGDTSDHLKFSYTLR